MKNTKAGFSIYYEAEPITLSGRGPYKGLWIASTDDGDFNGTGETIKEAMANLIISMHQYLLDREQTTK